MNKPYPGQVSLPRRSGSVLFMKTLTSLAVFFLLCGVGTAITMVLWIYVPS